MVFYNLFSVSVKGIKNGNKKATCDKIVLVAGDSDFIASIKFVRKEGILVYLYTMGHKVKAKLVEHSDFKLS